MVAGACRPTLALRLHLLCASRLRLVWALGLRLVCAVLHLAYALRLRPRYTLHLGLETVFPVMARN